MSKNSRYIKEQAIELEESGAYEEAYIEDLLQCAKDELEGLEVDDIDDNLWLGILQSHSFPDKMDWCYSEIDGILADIGDQQRDLERDREWEEQ